MDFKYVLSQLSAYPGEQFQLGMQAFDELGRPTATILRLSETDVSLMCGKKKKEVGGFGPDVCIHQLIVHRCFAYEIIFALPMFKYKMNARLFLLYLQSHEDIMIVYEQHKDS